MPLHPDRIAWHKYMGTTDMCFACSGTGITLKRPPDSIDDYDFREAYCDCECGNLKMKLETGDDTQKGTK